MTKEFSNDACPFCPSIVADVPEFYPCSWEQRIPIPKEHLPFIRIVWSNPPQNIGLPPSFETEPYETPLASPTWESYEPEPPIYSPTYEPYEPEPPIYSPTLEPYEQPISSPVGDCPLLCYETGERVSLWTVEGLQCGDTADGWLSCGDDESTIVEYCFTVDMFDCSVQGGFDWWYYSEDINGLVVYEC